MSEHLTAAVEAYAKRMEAIKREAEECSKRIQADEARQNADPEIGEKHYGKP